MDSVPTRRAFCENTGAKWFVTEPGNAFIYILKPISDMEISSALSLLAEQSKSPWIKRSENTTLGFIAAVFFDLFRRKPHKASTGNLSWPWLPSWAMEWPVGVWSRAQGWNNRSVKFPQVTANLTVLQHIPQGISRITKSLLGHAIKGNSHLSIAFITTPCPARRVRRLHLWQHTMQNSL